MAAEVALGLVEAEARAAAGVEAEALAAVGEARTGAVLTDTELFSVKARPYLGAGFFVWY